MKTIGIDPGNAWGFAFSANGEVEATGAKKYSSLLGIERDFRDILDIWRPEAVVLCRPFGANAVVIRKQSAQAAIFELTCQRLGVPYFELADSSLRKSVFGDGRKKKADIQAHFGTATDHESDACTAAVYGSLFLEKK